MRKVTLNRAWIYQGTRFLPGEHELDDETYTSLKERGAFQEPQAAPQPQVEQEPQAAPQPNPEREAGARAEPDPEPRQRTARKGGE